MKKPNQNPHVCGYGWGEISVIQRLIDQRNDFPYIKRSPANSSHGMVTGVFGQPILSTGWCLEPLTGYDPMTFWLQIKCSTNWATEAIWVGSDAFCLPRPRRCGMFQPRAYRDTIQSRGRSEIRTHGTFRYGGFQDRWIKPLSHSSLYNCIRYGVRTRASAVKGQRVNRFTNRTCTFRIFSVNIRHTYTRATFFTIDLNLLREYQTTIPSACLGV